MGQLWMWHQYAVGFRQNWKRTFGWAVSAWGCAWLFVNSICFLFPAAKSVVDQNNVVVFFAFICLSVCVVFWRLPAVVFISLDIPTTNSKVEILFGDLFREKEHLAIPVTEYFDAQLGEAVALNSVHGQFVHWMYEGNTIRAQADFDAALAGKECEEKPRADGRANIYPIGTTIAISSGAKRFFLFALAKTDPATFKARADAIQMLQALDGLWRVVRVVAAGKTVSIPLVGAGQSQVGLKPPHLIRLILLSILTATRTSEITTRIRIVLHPDMMKQVDLGAIEREWV